MQVAAFAAMSIITTGAAITSSGRVTPTTRTHGNLIVSRDERYFCLEENNSHLQAIIGWWHNLKTQRKYLRIANRNHRESALYRLPNELLEHVAMYLPPADLLTLVRTCRHTAILQRRRYFDQPALLVYWRRMRRDVFASRLMLENKSWDLPGMLWCDRCSEFHPRTFFAKTLRDAPDDGRECQFASTVWLSWYFQRRIGVPERV